MIYYLFIVTDHHAMEEGEEVVVVVDVMEEVEDMGVDTEGVVVDTGVAVVGMVEEEDPPHLTAGGDLHLHTEIDDTPDLGADPTHQVCYINHQAFICANKTFLPQYLYFGTLCRVVQFDMIVSTSILLTKLVHIA